MRILYVIANNSRREAKLGDCLNKGNLPVGTKATGLYSGEFCDLIK